MAATIYLSTPENGTTTEYNLFWWGGDTDSPGFHIVRLYLDGVEDWAAPIMWNAGGSGGYCGLYAETWETVEIGSSHTWKMSVSTYPGDVFEAESETWTFTRVGSGPAKPTNPTPANDSGPLWSGPAFDFSDWTLSWKSAGWTETFTIRAGLSAENMIVISEHQVPESLVIPEQYRTSLIGGPIFWRVDAEAADYDPVEGDIWGFDPRPALAENPTPETEAVNVSLGLALLEWDAADYANTYDVYFGTDPEDLALLASEIAATQLAIAGPFAYGTTYYWRVDAANANGTTTGDVWSFTTLSFDPPLPSWELLPGRTLGPLDFGIEGIDFRWLGNNFGTTVKRLVVAANNRIYYEDV